MELSTEIRAQIIVLIHEGYSYREVAKRFQVSLGAVQKSVSRYNASGHFFSNPRTGRPRVTTKRTDNMIKRIAVTLPMASSSYVASQLPQMSVPSCRTIRRRLQSEFHLRAQRPAKKPKLTLKNIKDRIKFCKEHKHWTANDWSKVLFSDETLIKQFYSNAPYVRRPPKQPYNPRYTISTVRSCPSVMIWGTISVHGGGEICFIPSGTTINAQVYLNILRDKLKRSMTVTGCTTFMQDGAPCHNAKIVKHWMAAQRIAILTNWPGSSPDINPIENIRALIKRKVAALKPSSLQDLQRKVLDVWEDEVTSDYCSKLIASMPDRIRAVITAKGLHTKY